MLFHSAQFGIFFVLVLIFSAALSRHRYLRHSMLLLASYVFYMAWNVRYLGLILFSTLLDYVIGAQIHRTLDPKKRKLLLAMSIAGNLAVLGTFKYYGFFAENLESLLKICGLHSSLPVLKLLLPVGISFYTFQSLSYTIDIYRGVLEPRKSFIEFALFVAFFPQLVAGPIVRAKQFLPQLDRELALSGQRVGSGIYLILKGLVKKTCIADMLGLYLVDPVFASPTNYGVIWALVALYSFKFQIYNDFSGYSDIAIGTGRLLGFDLPMNFRSPYKANSISDYWARWHMTLGSWFRDYVYYPLGGSRRGGVRTCINLLVTMGLVGLWHGANWTFVIWGGYYGALLCVHWLYRKWKGRRNETFSALGNAVRVFFTFQLTTLAVLPFRSPDLKTVQTLLFASRTAHAEPISAALLVLALAAVLHFTPERWKGQTEECFVRMPPLAQGACSALVMGLLVTLGGASNPYYYFQF